MDTSQLKFFDADVHIRWDDDATIAARLPQSWKERWQIGAGHTQAGVRINPKFYNPLEPFGATSLRTVGKQAVATPAELEQKWLQPHGIDGALVSVYDGPNISTFGDMDYPLEVTRAVNDWVAEEWLDKSPALYGTILVATQNPEEAAKEIRRAAKHARMVQVMLPTGSMFPYGNRRFFPIYEAAVECGVAIAIHSGTEGMGTSPAPTPCGWPGTLSELRVTRSTTFLGHLTSMITEGVFVRFPELRVIGLEVGVAWLSAYLWRFDKNYKGLRSECPWLKELPSEYTRRFFRFGTQSAEPGEPASEFWRLLGSNRLDETLMFSSNYPRWDHDTPVTSHVMASADPAKIERLKIGVARETFPRFR
ncbi:MAG: amidohydrolase family protein [Magnetospirillum sp.]|nr:amidohydrolase family protein [Magnetospirillum sp.]